MVLAHLVRIVGQEDDARDHVALMLRVGIKDAGTAQPGPISFEFSCTGRIRYLFGLGMASRNFPSTQA